MTFAVDDPVDEGWVASLARPGGNITGVTLSAAELTGKRLEIIKAALPAIRRIAVLAWQRPGSLGQVKLAADATRSLGIEHHVIQVGDASQYDGAFERMKRQQTDALLVLSECRLLHRTASDRRPGDEAPASHDRAVPGSR
jgi:putative tryptophan/tyrosine transport system substrate-binding protein